MNSLIREGIKTMQLLNNIKHEESSLKSSCKAPTHAPEVRRQYDFFKNRLSLPVCDTITSVNTTIKFATLHLPVQNLTHVTLTSTVWGLRTTI
jgi:hypothetical protein